ncbi:MAG: hypothetical protein KGZ37_06360 [Nitrosarchaeum sp.]|nr:hypothetical protein [Nitrosarchaeum sp.]
MKSFEQQSLNQEKITRSQFIKTGAKAVLATILFTKCAPLLNNTERKVPELIESWPEPEAEDIEKYLKKIYKKDREELEFCLKQYQDIYKTYNEGHAKVTEVLLNKKLFSFFVGKNPFKHINVNPQKEDFGAHYLGETRIMFKHRESSPEKIEDEEKLLGQNTSSTVDFFLLIKEMSHKVNRDAKIPRLFKILNDVRKERKANEPEDEFPNEKIRLRDAYTNSYENPQSVEFQAHSVTERAMLIYLFDLPESKNDFATIYNACLNVYDFVLKELSDLPPGVQKKIIEDIIKPSNLDAILSTEEFNNAKAESIRKLYHNKE